MRWGKIIVGAGALAALTLSCGEEEGPTAVGSWQVYAPPYAGAWTNCDVTGDGTFWATVQLDGSAKAAIVRRRNGNWAKWEFAPDETEALNDLVMFDDGRGWACGRDGALLQYDGASWQLTRLYDDLEYFNLGGTDAGHVWVNGISRPYGTPAIFFYDGAGWQEHTKPARYDNFGPIYPLTTRSCYMVGHTRDGDDVLYFDASSWRLEMSFDEALYIYDLAGAGDYLYAVGEARAGSSRGGRVYELTPTRREITPSTPAPDRYYYVAGWADALGNLWLAAAPYAPGGQDYKLLYWDGAGWSEAAVVNGTGTTSRFFALDFDGPGDGWAVGGTAYARYRRP